MAGWASFHGLLILNVAMAMVILTKVLSPREFSYCCVPSGSVRSLEYWKVFDTSQSPDLGIETRPYSKHQS